MKNYQVPRTIADGHWQTGYTSERQHPGHADKVVGIVCTIGVLALIAVIVFQLAPGI